MGSWRTVRTIDGWFMDAVVFHPNRNELYYQTQRHNSTGEDPQQLWKVSLPSGQPVKIATVPFGREGMHKRDQLDISPDGNTLLLVTGDQVSHLIPTAGGAERTVAGARRFTPEGNLLVITTSGSTGSLGLSRSDGSAIWKVDARASDLGNQNMSLSAGFGGPENKLYWISGEGKLSSGDYRNNALTTRPLPEKSGEVLAIGTDNILYLVAEDPYVIRAYRLPGLENLRTIGEEILRPAQLAASESSGLLAWGNGGIKTLTVAGRRVVIGRPDGTFTGGNLNLSTNEKLLAAGSRSIGSFSYWLAGGSEGVKRFATSFGYAYAALPNAAGDRVAVVGPNGFMVMNTATHKYTVREELAETAGRYDEDVAFSPDGTSLLLNLNRRTPGVNQTTATLQLYDPVTKAVRWERPGNLNDPFFSPDGKKLNGQIYQFFVELDAATGRETRRWPIPNQRFPTNPRYNAERTLIAYEHDYRGYLYDLKTSKEYQLTVAGEVLKFRTFAFLGNDYLLSAGRDEMVELWDLKTRRRVARLVQYLATDDWAVVADDGRFDASAGAMQKMYYRVGNRSIPLEQLYEGFYTPGLLGQLLERGQSPLAPPPVNIGSVTPPPGVTLTYATGTRNLIVEDDAPSSPTISASVAMARITVGATAPGSRVTEIRLYHNGKLVDSGTRNLVVEDDTPDQRVYNLTLLPGENRLRAVAVNAQRTESSPAELLIDFTPPAPALSTPMARERITLHLITVGINQYKNPRYNLNYAEADAGGLAEAIRTGMNKLVTDTKVYSIRNAGATRADILLAIQTVTAGAEAGDIFVFYYAGHGVMSEGGTKDFYLVPYDVTQLYGDNTGLAARGISATELKQLAAAIPAQKQLYILDACQSAGAVQSIASRGAAEEKAIAQLARSTGTHWLTASGSEQFANEFDQLGHGAFTYVLLQALSGKAAGSDNSVTVNELKAYLDLTVPEITEKYSGQAQYPASYGFGQDFPVSVK